MRMMTIGGILAFLALPAAANAQLVLKASHQFPGGKGDVRDDMVQMIAKEAKAANVGLDVQVYPGASLFKPNQQWNAMVDGQLDVSLFPLDYASGKVPLFSATLMPGLIRNQDRARRINASPFMTDVRDEIDKNGVIVLSDAWFAGGMAAKGNCILKPEDLRGMKFRAAGPTFAAMWEAAGASIVSPPSNEIYNAFQTGVVTGTDTSLGTFASTRLYEVTDCLTAPGNNALWFMYEPVLMSKISFGKLNKQQQDAIIRAGKDAQSYYESKADAVNSEAVAEFKDHKVKVYAKFNADVPDGQKLIAEALAVQ
jgi:TRAP-type transport system periplasmic protein